MSSRAHVHSLEAIQAVRGALVSFIDQVQQALATLDVQMRRMLDWLEHDRPAYWRRQIREAIDEVNEAQAALHRCLMFPIGDQRPSCREERAALKRAQARLAYCQQKAEKVRHWISVVRREMFEYEGRISQLVRVIEVDGPHAIGVLDRIMHHLEEYRAVRRSDSAASYEDMALADEVWLQGATNPARAKAEGATGSASAAAPEKEGTLAEPVAPPSSPPDAHPSLPKGEGTGD